VITGHKWWQAHYPKSGVITANEIHIPAGRPLSIRLESADVLHEFWVAQLTRKMATVQPQGAGRLGSGTACSAKTPESMESTVDRTSN
jgi:hypothetical protein